MPDKIFLEKIRQWNISLDDDANKKIDLFAEKIIEKNKIINLVSRKDIENIWRKHILDSVPFCNLIEKLNILNQNNIADIGSGGGFPAIVLSIILKNSNFTLFESNSKKYEFLVWIKNELKLSNVQVQNKRITKHDRLSFDIVTERAAAKIEDIIPLCRAICKENGYIVVWQSSENLNIIEKTMRPYFIYNYFIEENRALFVFKT
jgi:16S rRNA (guanine527-N7)-methyltransferase